MELVLAVIVACEVGFWVLIGAGLLARYPLRRPRLGLVLLALTPVVDVVLLAATVLDLRHGATASVAHGLAAVYLGFSLAYGHAMIRWADVRFAHWFAGGPPPVKRYGAAYARQCWTDVVRSASAAAVAAGLLLLLERLVDDAARTEALRGLYPVLGVVLAVELVWAVSYTLWPRREPARA